MWMMMMSEYIYRNSTSFPSRSVLITALHYLKNLNVLVWVLLKKYIFKEVICLTNQSQLPSPPPYSAEDNTYRYRNREIENEIIFNTLNEWIVGSGSHSKVCDDLSVVCCFNSTRNTTHTEREEGRVFLLFVMSSSYKPGKGKIYMKLRYVWTKTKI